MLSELLRSVRKDLVRNDDFECCRFSFILTLISLPSSAGLIDAQGQPVYMTAGPGGMAVQGQAVDANGMVRTQSTHCTALH